MRGDGVQRRGLKQPRGISGGDEGEPGAKGMRVLDSSLLLLFSLLFSLLFFSFFLLFFNGCASSIWKFLGQGLNLSHSYSNVDLSFFLSFFLYFSFLGPHSRHMEVSRLGVESELQLLVYTTATATSDPSHVCNPNHGSRQHRILNPLSEARD